MTHSEDWYDIPSDEMTLEQARQAVKDLRKKLAEYLEQELTTKNNCISRDSAIKALDYDIKCFKFRPGVSKYMSDIVKLLNIIYEIQVNNIKALPPVTIKTTKTIKTIITDDCISRQAVIDMTGLSEWFDSSDSYNEFVIALSELPPVTPQEPRWIPVSERLPEDYEDVLVSGEDIVKQAQFIKGIFECEDDGVYALVYALLSDEKVIDADFTFKALAWMPLPKPYEPQESEDKE